MSINPNGLILWEGPSLLDGAPIVVIATGIRTSSTNTKTGGLVQTYILRSDMPPAEAIKIGADESICGGCVHRGDGTGKERSCYVTILHGPRGVYAAYKRGSYAVASGNDLDTIFTGKTVRLGAYGDPAAAPSELWERILAPTTSHTGYTHQWRSVDPTAWAPLVMASVDSVEEMDKAHSMGYRTFRVTPVGETAIKGREIVCPASEEAGRKTTCEECRACGGTTSKARVSIQIAAHGTGKKYVHDEENLEAVSGRADGTVQEIRQGQLVG